MQLMISKHTRMAYSFSSGAAPADSSVSGGGVGGSGSAPMSGDLKGYYQASEQAMLKPAPHQLQMQEYEAAARAAQEQANRTGGISAVATPQASVQVLSITRATFKADPGEAQQRSYTAQSSGRRQAPAATLSTGDAADGWQAAGAKNQPKVQPQVHSTREPSLAAQNHASMLASSELQSDREDAEFQAVIAASSDAD